MLRHNVIEALKSMQNQLAWSDVSSGGDGQQASATRATMTTVALIGSMAFSCLYSQSDRWLKSTTPYRGESVVNFMRVRAWVVTLL